MLLITLTLVGGEPLVVQVDDVAGCREQSFRLQTDDGSWELDVLPMPQDDGTVVVDVDLRFSSDSQSFWSQPTLRTLDGRQATVTVSDQYSLSVVASDVEGACSQRASNTRRTRSSRVRSEG
jgi:hypothetical protein